MFVNMVFSMSRNDVKRSEKATNQGTFCEYEPKYALLRQQDNNMLTLHAHVHAWIFVSYLVLVFVNAESANLGRNDKRRDAKHPEYDVDGRCQFNSPSNLLSFSRNLDNVHGCTSRMLDHVLIYERWTAVCTASKAIRSGWNHLRIGVRLSMLSTDTRKL